MGEPEAADITQMLLAAADGDERAADRLLPAVYEQLRAMAAALLRQERPDHTLQPTGLVHEAYLKLVDQDRVRWQSRAHFTAVAATAMRRILINHARARARHKRGGDRQRLQLQDADAPAPERGVDLLALDEALEALAELDPRQARLVEMRYFGGLSMDECAEVLATSVRTLHREWAVARAWLRGRLSRDDDA